MNNIFSVADGHQLVRDLGYSFNEVLWMILIPLTISIIIAGYIGLERQNVGKAAGVSAHILVGLGSAGLAIMQRLMYYSQIKAGIGDPEGQRIIAQVVAGVGFIGAGVILKDVNNTIRGLTTAGTIWAVAMVCLILGSGYLILGSIVGGVMVLFITLRDFKRGINPFKKLPHNREDHE
ncbi:MgtC/SapB family transporter [Alteracholeplasma palmae J233]|uniref:MgtC/SapB family transporter n=1 Tax=Alteracholeplasma palmae (strain ATCC 49389 / J233) TaxID=1318466 RepID=U4KSG6_ALTPJ|nr:MgtC/SapB family protein [Alteracholeplasma palmae]CCV64991.1 MgtC/SapB family transporter [Alteracholeplasma palmae J233]